MRILIFGATGAFGTEFEIVARERGATVTGLGHSDVDIRDSVAVRNWVERAAPDVIVNCVTLMGINPCEESPDLAFQIHASAVLNLAKICAEHDCVFVQPSSHAVFDGTQSRPYLERDEPRPLNIYGVSKLAGETIARTRCTGHYVVRFPTLFAQRRNASLGFVDKMIDALQAGRPVRVADDKIDSPSYGRDVAAAVYDLLEDRAAYGLYHLANAGAVSYLDFIGALKAMLGSRSQITPAKDKDFPSLAPKALYTALKSAKLPPLRSWDDALQSYLADRLLTEKKAFT